MSIIVLILLKLALLILILYEFKEQNSLHGHSVKIRLIIGCDMNAGLWTERHEKDLMSLCPRNLSSVILFWSINYPKCNYFYKAILRAGTILSFNSGIEV